ncbi:uncharacterized protein HGUI_00033 [Hanseniaspora guilliermondii]|uniref:Mitochondrial ATPase complex subunit ATP10 n=1 Tax=Hanseniaspora guilliermondii TaxID=56406 RepID=A0A1L0CHQ9_9ASCO|nr:uncharacterized protein HGUI_00033 [Hanseniaspora guilliermondii]
MFKPNFKLLTYRKLVPSDFGKEGETTVHKFLSALQIRTAKRELYYFDKNVKDTIPGLSSEPKDTDVYSDYMNIIKNRSEEASAEKLQKLRMEQVFSSVYCMKMATEFKGKMFTSPTSAFDKKISKYIPHMPVKGIDGKNISLETKLKDKVSILVITPNIQSATEWSSSWFKKGEDNMLKNPAVFDKYNDDFLKNVKQLKRNPNLNKFNKQQKNKTSNTNSEMALPLQIVQINSINSFVQRLVNFFMEKSLFKGVPKEYQDKFFTYNITKDLSFSLRYNLNLFNPYSPVILVVDQDMKIRWTASGAASSEKERELLWKVVNDLRLQK